MNDKMGKEKRTERAITLIALVITIIVLLILAGVTIAMLTGENGILNQANQAKIATEEATVEEQKRLSEYHDYITKEQYGAPIPEGFYYVGGSTNDGLVISDIEGDNIANTKGGNQFVWVAVENIDEMAKKVTGVDNNGRENYQGKLYDFTSTTATEMTTYGQGTTNCREPDIIADYDNNTDYNNGLLSKDSLQEEYNEMIESVMKHKGFYIARYEMSLDVDKNAQSKKNVTAVGAGQADTKIWYGLYTKAKAYERGNVKSAMIWGSQYDAMMRWMQKNNMDVTSITPIEGTSNNTSKITGSDEADQLNHIYDILGNSSEWTMEAIATDRRVNRGGSYSASSSPSYRHSNSVLNTSSILGTRLTLYW